MNNQIRILFVEDLPSDLELAERELRKGGLVFYSKNVDTEIGLLDALDKFHPDIVICDYSMPLFDGMQALKIVLDHDRNLPVVMLTGSMNELIAVECMKAGAIDYVIKEHITRLPFAVTEALEKKGLKIGADKASLIIHESEERFQTLFNEMMEGFALHEIICDNSGLPIDYIFLLMNPAFERLTGLRAKEVIGKSILEVMPDTEKHWIETYGKVALTGKPEVFENFSKELKKYFKVIAFSNKKNQFVTVFEDITPRKLAEETLLASKNQYQQLFNEMLLGSALHEIISNDMGEAIDYRTLDVNKGFEQMLGIKKEDIIGQLASSVLPEKELKDWLDIFAPVAKGKGSRYYEFYSSLNCKYFEGVVFSPENDQFAVTFNDVTKRKQSEISLRSTSLQLELALNSAKAGIWDWNVITGKIDWSPQMFVLFGLDPLLTESSFEAWRTALHPDDIVLAETRIEQALKQHTSLNSDYRVVFADGGVRWINATGEGVYDNNGNPVQMTGICTDISVRKKTEQENLEMKEILEKQNQHLEEVREKERAEISREIHDQLGQGLTALKIDLNWLHGKIANDSEEGKKIKGMIELVTATGLDIQRISSELRPPILDDLGLSAALEWYCEEYAIRTGLTLNMDMDDIQTESINKNLVIYRVLQESLTNIIRHSGAKTVQVKLQKIQKEIVLTIKDDGIGISQDKIKSFKSFGLMGMFERVKQSGGHMEIKTPQNGGTIVKIYIPVK